MKITKYLHSCLLIEKDGVRVLVDPGSYTYEEGVLDIERIEKLDVVLLTHAHQDHMSVPLLRDLAASFPGIRMVANRAVADLLMNEGIQISIQTPEFVETQDTPHEKALGPVPHNTLFHIFGEITHPGDSLQFQESKEVLALPIQAPWGSMVQALEKAVSLNPKPKLVIPIHDWHWKDAARRRLYEVAAEYLRGQGIPEFRGLEVGESVDIIHLDDTNNK